MFEPAGRVVVAVSGGPDSLCLLHALVRLRRLLRIEPVCFHFDHSLRDDSALDAAYVRRQAGRLAVPFVLRTAESRPGRGESVEAWARTVRYAALSSVLEELGGGVAAVGHTADDQAETVLIALLRGGGLEAISGMNPVNRPVVRPLIDVTRSETEAFCRSLRLRPKRDPMNEDPAYMRAAVRSLVLPELERALGRKVTSTLTRSAGLLRRDADLLQRLAVQAGALVVRREGADLVIDVRALATLHPAVASRVIRRALLDLGTLPEADHVDAVLALSATGRTGQRRILASGLRAGREPQYVRLSRPSPRSRATRARRRAQRST
jgi:tRNA(Ile)-lysidine synthase